MRLEFDPTKDASNQLKHGVSLAMAAELDWDAAWVWVDERVNYNEMRTIALAPKTEILYCVAFVDRGDVRRIISLRRANRREVKHYVENDETLSSSNAKCAGRPRHHRCRQARPRCSTADKPTAQGHGAHEGFARTAKV